VTVNNIYCGFWACFWIQKYKQKKWTKKETLWSALSQAIAGITLSTTTIYDQQQTFTHTKCHVRRETKGTRPVKRPSNAVITIAIRLRYDYDASRMRFHSTQAKKWVSIFCRSRIVVTSQSNRTHNFDHFPHSQMRQGIVVP